MKIKHIHFNKNCMNSIFFLPFITGALWKKEQILDLNLSQWWFGYLFQCANFSAKTEKKYIYIFAPKVKYLKCNIKKMNHIKCRIYCFFPPKILSIGVFIRTFFDQANHITNRRLFFVVQKLFRVDMCSRVAFYTKFLVHVTPLNYKSTGKLIVIFFCCCLVCSVDFLVIFFFSRFYVNMRLCISVTIGAHCRNRIENNCFKKHTYTTNYYPKKNRLWRTMCVIW